jgi:hypothetical protein
MALVACTTVEDALTQCKEIQHNIKYVMQEVQRVGSEVERVLLDPVLSTPYLDNLWSGAYKAAGNALSEAYTTLLALVTSFNTGLTYPAIATFGFPAGFTGCILTGEVTSNKFILGACCLTVPGSVIDEANAPWSANASYQDSFNEGDVIEIEEIDYAGGDTLLLAGKQLTIEALSVASNTYVFGGVTYYTIKMVMTQTVAAVTGQTLNAGTVKMATAFRIRKVSDYTAV